MLLVDLGLVCEFVMFIFLLVYSLLLISVFLSFIPFCTPLLKIMSSEKHDFLCYIVWIGARNYDR